MSGPKESGRQTPSPQRRRIGDYLKRGVLALVAPLVVFGTLELGLRVGGFGVDLRMFVPDDALGFYRTNPHFTSLYFPSAFRLQALPMRIAAKKPSGTKRFFLLGESAAMGSPAPEFGMAAQLRAMLRAQYPDTPIEIYNLGVTAINSFAVREIARETMPFEPDALLVYMGNNEVVGPYGPGSFSAAAAPSRFLLHWSIAARRLRVGQLLQRLGSLPRRVSPEWRGMRMFMGHTVAQNDPRLGFVRENFAANLTDIVTSAEAHAVPVILSTVVANVRECAPFVSLSSGKLSAQAQGEWRREFQAGLSEWRLGRMRQAEPHLQAAQRLDPSYAATLYLLGRVELALGKAENARIHLCQALEADALRFRPDEEINAIIRATARQFPRTVLLMDPANEWGFASSSVKGLPGRDLFLEHVHFSFAGNYRMAGLFAEAISRRKILGVSSVRPVPPESEIATTLAYTSYARLAVLWDIAKLTEAPPFLDQVDHFEDTFARHQTLASLAGAATEEQRLTEIRTALESALVQDPKNPVLLERLLNLPARTRNAVTTETYLDQLQQLQPSDPNRLLLESDIRAQQGDRTRARALLKRVTGVPGYTVPTTTRLAALETDARERLAVLESGLQKMPQSRRLRSELVQTLLATGDRATAESRSRLFLEDDPGDESLLALLAELVRPAGAPAELALRAQYASSQPDNFTNNAALGESYLKQGDTVKALAFLLRAVETGKLPAELVVALAKLQYESGDRSGMQMNLARAVLTAEAEGKSELVRAIRTLLAESLNQPANPSGR